MLFLLDSCMIKRQNNIEIATYVVLAIIIAVVAFNQYQLSIISGRMVNTGSSSNSGSVDLMSFLPRGIPSVYGQELGVSFDDPVNSLSIMSAMDGDLYPTGELKFDQLTDSQKQRYLRIGSSISCEFCCGAKTLIAPDGRAACGCAHSAAMRTLAKYLLKNHENEFTDEQILEELVKWKTMFFPKQMLPRLAQQNGQQVSLTELPDMVGGC